MQKPLKFWITSAWLDEEKSSQPTAHQTSCSNMQKKPAAAASRLSLQVQAVPRILPGMVAAKTTLPVIGVPVKITRPQRLGLALFHCADAGWCACGKPWLLGKRERPTLP